MLDHCEVSVDVFARRRGGHRPSVQIIITRKVFSPDQLPWPTELGIRGDVAEISDNLLFNSFGSFIIASHHFD